jgi:hypothetical protein
VENLKKIADAAVIMEMPANDTDKAFLKEEAPPPPPNRISEKIASNNNSSSSQVNPSISKKIIKNGDLKIQVGDIKKLRIRLVAL